MRFSTTVRVIVAEVADQPLAGVRVALFDRDHLTGDDPLGTTVTDDNGEARFQFESDRFVDLDEELTTEMPDLFAVVYDADGQEVMNTRADTVPNSPRTRLTVPVPRERAVRHRLLPQEPQQG